MRIEAGAFTNSVYLKSRFAIASEIRNPKSTFRNSYYFPPPILMRRPALKFKRYALYPRISS
jgi:hypothetical protein